MRALEKVRPCDNPFNAQRIDALPYVEHAIMLDDVMDRLEANGYRGALCGPHGCGKSAMLEALGPRLQAKGLTPVPLFINSDERGPLPKRWLHAMREARADDALLLDGYDLLRPSARLRAQVLSRSAGAVIVTTHRDVAYKTIARPTPSATLLATLIERLSAEHAKQIDAAALLKSCKGNLRDALRLAYDEAALG